MMRILLIVTITSGLAFQSMAQTGISGIIEQNTILTKSNSQFTFTEAVSFVISCETQEEVDRYWQKLSEGGKTQMCGWLKDKFGLSWQVVPTIVSDMMVDENRERAQRVMNEILRMKKIDIKTLQEAYEGQVQLT